MANKTIRLSVGAIFPKVRGRYIFTAINLTDTAKPSVKNPSGITGYKKMRQRDPELAKGQEQIVMT